MESKKPSVNLKVSRSSMETENLKVGNTSMEAEKLKVSSSSIEAEKLKLQTTSSETVTVHLNKTTSGSGESDKIQKLKSGVGQTITKSRPVPVDERPYDLIKNINQKKEIWRLGVMLDDMWIVYKSDKEDHIDMVLRDTKGDTIQATIMENQLEEWNGKLSEGKTYYMRNFKVHANDQGTKYAPHSFRLTFSGATRIDEAVIEGMAADHFSFINFADIKDGKFKPDVLVDAIGLVDSIKKVVTASANKKGKVEFLFKDLSDNVIDVTLWDAYSVDFLKFFNERDENVPAVMIIKYARAKEQNGIYPIQLTNAWNGTKLLFDRTLPAIKDYITSLPKDVTYATQSITPSYSSQYYTQASGGSQYDPHENFMRQGQVISIGDMTKLKSDTYCVTVAETSHIITNSQGWFYRSCIKCNCKAEGKVAPYVCRKGHSTENPPIKYKLDIQVVSGEDMAKLVFWDNTLDDLLGMTAATLLQEEEKRGYGDPQEYPLDLDHIMERKFAFRVKWTKDWGGQASVLECKDDPQLIAKIQEHLPVAESTMQEVEPIQEEGVGLSDSPPIQKFTQADIDNFAHLDDSILCTPNVSAVADNDVSVSSHKTYGKRSAGKQVAVESTNLDSQFSSTRSGKLIKKEKP